MHITYFGHSALLIEIGGKKILSDPNFDPASQRSLARVSEHETVTDELPKLDMILLTHAHAGLLSSRSMVKIQRTPLFAPPAVARWVRRHGMNGAIGFGPGESLTSGSLTVYPEAAPNSSDRHAANEWHTQKNMYLIVTKYESALLVGDISFPANTTTVVEQELKGRRLDVAVLSVGCVPNGGVKFGNGSMKGLDVLTLLERLDPRHLVLYNRRAGSRVTAPIDTAVRELREATATHGRGAGVQVLDPGEFFHASSLSS